MAVQAARDGTNPAEQMHSVAIPPVHSLRAPVSSPPAFDPAVFDTLHASVDGDADFLADLLDDYLNDAQELLDTMQAAADNKERRLLERSAHSLKSTSETVGAMALSDVCATIEHHAHEDELHAAAARLPDAAACFDAVKAPLRDRKATLEAG